MRIPSNLTNVAFCAAVAVVALATVVPSARSQEPIDRASGSHDARELDFKFIDAELSLVKAHLEFVLEQNNKRSGSYSSIVVEELRLRIKLYEVWRNQLETDNPQFIPIDIQKAKGELKLAQMRLDADQKLRTKIRSSVSESRLKRRRLAVESAKAWLEKVSHPSYAAQTKDERIQWRFIVLGKGLLETRLEWQRQ